MFDMYKILMVAAMCMALVACGETPLEKSYNQALASAKADCVKKGDEFMPYGASAWITMVNDGKPMNFRCVSLTTKGKVTVAAYSFRVNGDNVSYTIK